MSEAAVVPVEEADAAAAGAVNTFQVNASF